MVEDLERVDGIRVVAAMLRLANELHRVVRVLHLQALDGVIEHVDVTEKRAVRIAARIVLVARHAARVHLRDGRQRGVPRQAVLLPDGGDLHREIPTVVPVAAAVLWIRLLVVSARRRAARHRLVVRTHELGDRVHDLRLRRAERAARVLEQPVRLVERRSRVACIEKHTRALKRKKVRRQHKRPIQKYA